MEPTIITVTETAFDGAKVWYKSRTMVGSIVAVVALAVSALGYDVDAILQTEVADTFMNIAGLAGAVYAIYGRVLATKTLSVRPS
jgi:hypothetical protein